MIVVDACAWVDYFLEALPPDVEGALTSDDLVGPPHVDWEVGSALLRRERTVGLGITTAKALIVGFVQLPFERVRHPADIEGAFDFMNNASFHDAIYLALARRLNSPVMTSDKGMIDAARIGGVDVIDARPDE